MANLKNTQKTEQIKDETAQTKAEQKEFKFTTDWFSYNIPSFNIIIENIKPKKILEIGSFEGRSAIHFVQEATKYNEIEIICVDTWQGGEEHHGIHNMNNVEVYFDYNIFEALPTHSFVHKAQIFKQKGYSHDVMIDLLAKGYAGQFDIIYIDGSHQAPDVLFDAVLAFKLVRVGGVIIFDDYLWAGGPEGVNHYGMVKPAVDSFMSCYQRKMQILQGFPIYQLYTQKVSD